MSFLEPSDLPPTGSPDDISEFSRELNLDASRTTHSHEATIEQQHDSEAVGALIRADKLIAGYFPGSISSMARIYTPRRAS